MPIEEDHLKAEVSSVARRLGVSQRNLVKLLRDKNVKVTNSLCSIEAVVNMLGQLTQEELVTLKSSQKPITRQPEGLYAGKFSPLEPFAPTPEVKEPTPAAHPTAAGIVQYSTMLTTPIDAQHIAQELNISVRRAKEFAALVSLPQYSSTTKKQKVWEKSDFDSRKKNLTRKEETLVSLWKRQYSGGSHVGDEQIAHILSVEESLVPAVKEEYGLSKTFPLTREMVERLLDDPDFKKKASKARTSPAPAEKKSTRSSKYISQAELANKKNLSPAEVKTLIGMGVIPREEGGRILRSKVMNLTKSFLSKRLRSEYEHNLTQASELLEVSVSVVKRLIKKFDITPTAGYATGYGQWVNTYKVSDLLKLKDTPDYQRSLTLAKVHKADKEKNAAELSAFIQEEKTRISDGVTVNVRERTQKPEKATLYVGPTNSGKTYNSLEALFTEYDNDRTGGVFVYAGPLRMLAYEVYEKMVARYGPEDVGFLTGEEQINPDAHLLACTVEMAPDEGVSLVLDETHWIVDADRGQHWTNLLIGGLYQNLHILTAAEAVPVISTLVNDSTETVMRTFERKTPLKFKGKLTTSDVPPRTAVVCFSRKSVYAVAHELEKHGKKVGVLYGALPLAARKAQIKKYIKGTYDIMVTTDVIGHGINLPIDNVVFAQTEKYDGQEIRELHTWEAAQIAGRAGRFGLSDEGSVYMLQGQEWFTQNTTLIQQGTLAGAGTVKTDLTVDNAVITPRFKDLGVTQQKQILFALESWEEKANALLADRPIIASTSQEKKRILRAVAEGLNYPLYPWAERKTPWSTATEELWQLISGPFNPDGETLLAISEWLGTRNREHSHQLTQHLDLVMSPLDEEVYDIYNEMGDEVDPLEKSMHAVGELKMAYVMFNNLGTLTYSEILEAEDRLNEAIINTLQRLITQGLYGTCSTCSEHCSPWFRYCEDCFYNRSAYYSRPYLNQVA